MEDKTIKSDVSTMPNLVQNAEKILKFWEEKNNLEKSIHQRDGSNSFTFY
jgi:isoleucyl-tRNA synthetase